MKTVYILNGPVGVLKEEVCLTMKMKLIASVYLNLDSLWQTNPFILNAETKNMLIDNASYIINNYLKSDFYQNIIISCSMPDKEIIDELEAKLLKAKIVKVILIRDEKLINKETEKLLSKNLIDYDFLDYVNNDLDKYQILSGNALEFKKVNDDLIKEIIELENN